MINIVVPMAGRGSRFAQAGYELPKPLLETRGRPMISLVIENLQPAAPHRFIFICQREHVEKYDLCSVIRKSSPGAEVILIDRVTEGAACTVLLAESLIDNTSELMIANCDQYVAVDIDCYLERMHARNYDGFIMTMTASDPKWSFVGLNGTGEVNQVVEKRVISAEATVGIYNYRHGSDFVAGANAMIAADDRVNGEFYVAPVYNRLIAEGKKVGIMNIGGDRAGMYGLGVPADLEYFNALEALPGTR